MRRHPGAVCSLAPYFAARGNLKQHKARTRAASSSGVTVSMLAGPSRWGQAPGRSAAHGRSLAGPVDLARISPLALDPYLHGGAALYHRQHLRIFGVSNFVILDAWFSPDQCWGVLAGLWRSSVRASSRTSLPHPNL